MLQPKTTETPIVFEGSTVPHDPHPLKSSDVVHPTRPVGPSSWIWAPDGTMPGDDSW